MSYHKTYGAIINAVNRGRLKEPFGPKEFRGSCPGFSHGTYNAFLYKHRLGNGKTTELFEKISAGKFRLIEPYKYGLHKETDERGIAENKKIVNR